MWLTLLGAVLGAIVAALVAVLIEMLRKPQLVLRIEPSSEMKYDNQRPARIKRAARLLLANRPLPKWASWMSRNAAQQCTGHIVFRHLDGQDVFGRTMLIRWTGADQPLPLTFLFEGKEAQVIDPGRITLEQRMDVYAGTEETLDVACRYDEEEECYGWNNESFFCAWRNPQWKLAKGRYLVDVTVLSSGQKCKGLFRLVNDVSRPDFRLEDALPEDYEKVKGANR